MRPVNPVPPELAAGPLSRRRALAQVSEHDLAGPSYQRVLRGAHATAATTLTQGVRIRAVRAVLPDAAVLGGRSALWAHGVELAEPGEPVEVVLPLDDRVRSRPEVRMRGDLLRPEEIVMTRWGPATSPARTAFDLGRRGGVRTSVPLLDALAHRTRVTVDQIEAVARAHRGARNCRRLPVALDLMDDGAESVRESLLRLVVVGAGFPRPVTQHEIRDLFGWFVARVDLAWPHLRLALEYDGAYHDDPAQIARDRARMNAIHACGWTTLVVDRTQLRHEARVIAQLRTLHAAAQNPPLTTPAESDVAPREIGRASCRERVCNGV